MRRRPVASWARHVGWILFTVAVTAGLVALFVWLGTIHATWRWGVVLPLAYAVGALLYRYEALLPAWASRLVCLAGEYVPTVKLLAKLDDVREVNGRLVHDLDLILREYALPPLPPKTERDLAERGRPLTIGMAARRLTRAVPSLPDWRLLVLLHGERFGLSTATIWRACKRDRCDEVARLLLRSDRLPPASPAFDYTAKDVTTLLVALRDFDVDLVAGELRVLGAFADRRLRFARFLERNGVALAPPWSASLVDEFADVGELPNDVASMARLESAVVALTLLDRVDGSATDPALRLVHLGIFLAEHDLPAPALEKHACWLAVRSEGWEAVDPLQVLHAYLAEKRVRALSGAPGMTLRELDDGWQEWSDRERDAEGSDAYTADLAALRAELASGHWATWRRPGGDYSHEVEAVHEEIREPDAYLITMDDRSGPVSELVEQLKNLPHGPYTYRFGTFTRNTRLGILPPGMPFHEFHETFVRDMDEILRRRRTVLPKSRWLPEKRSGALAVEWGGVRNIKIRGGRHGTYRFTVTRPPDHGQLSEPMRVDRNHALVTYLAGAVPEHVPDMVSDSFEYRADRTDEVADPIEHTVDFDVHPPGVQPLEHVEITLERIDLEHCRELWFGDGDLGGVLRSPSIYDVWSAIEGNLGDDEKPAVKRAFDRIAGER